MKKILATIIKEWTLARRDVAGLMLLFLMPAVLIIVMAMVQDAPFKDYQELKFDLLVADNDNGSIARSIIEGLKESGSFRVTDSIDGEPVSEDQLKHLLQSGDFKVGIVIPKGATAEMVNAANLVANSISEQTGMGKMPSREARDSMYIRMYFDPVSKPTFRMSVNFALDKLITFSSSRVLVERLSKMRAATATDTTGSAPDNTEPTVIAAEARPDLTKTMQGLGIKEQMLGEAAGDSKYMNSVQHNVPAWAIFGMFFIVIPICSHLIREREEGSSLRIELIPGARRYVALGKILFYTLVCALQFVVMFCVGIFLLPLLGLPALYLGQNAWVLLPVAVAIAVAATSYGYFIGVVFRTANQAMPFGAISVVILSALGGIWVPVDILSPLLQKAAMISPLYWGLDAVNNITLRSGGFMNVLPHIIVLSAFSTVLWVISTYRNKRHTRSVN
ncbi:MAG: ABC transporter permease [Chitinophagaceae bacterium]|nr:ABC transporter permease [Chitinophagaceae bacterium]MCB9046348.1 ABC transporter permease [Chitinophagales bacterium]